MLFKRGSTISAAEGGCQAEVGGMSSFATVQHNANIAIQWLVRWPVRVSQRAWVPLLRRYCRWAENPDTSPVVNVYVGCRDWYWYAILVETCGASFMST